MDADSAVASVGGEEYTTLSAAINAAADGDTIVLMQDITNDNVGSDAANASAKTLVEITKSITIQGNGNEITIDLSVPTEYGDRDQVFSVGANGDKTSTVVFTLDNVTMTITGKEDTK